MSARAEARLFFRVEDRVELRESAGFGVQDLRRAQELARKRRETILKKWHEYFGR
jgi:hypothetical protein